MGPVTTGEKISAWKHGQSVSRSCRLGVWYIRDEYRYTKWSQEPYSMRSPWLGAERRWTPTRSLPPIIAQHPKALLLPRIESPLSGLAAPSEVMSPSALGVTWVILTLTAIPASWLVLIPFSISTGHWWGQTVYGLTVTVMDSVFAIGTFHSLCLTSRADDYRR